ncbi:MAG TPA: MFS transporter [Candidatus Krumholzibacteria bacterium]|nr:MFS transporter [Candidatus Krumholzibacteria bacterium]HPD71882.1 MFS transporter [Candidatus Krumholzibacteria bacterium]HRY41185.1 MFS transporter [Candidatus Krumholzibacteria bacterium]
MTTDLERITTRRYLQAMVFQGIWTAGLYLFPFVLAKSLGAPGWLITVTVIMETTGLMLALYWGQLMAAGGRRRWLVWGGLGGRAVLIATPLVQTAGQFSLLLAVVYFFSAVIYPAQNGILQANLSPERRGAVYGRGALVQFLTAAAASLAVGGFLERDPDLFRWVYPVLGVLGFGYPLMLSRVPRPAGDLAYDPDRVFVVPRLPLGPVRWRRLAGALATPFREAAATFRVDRAFFRFETNFTIYGVAIMMLSPVVPLYFANELHLGYREIANSRVLIASLGVAVLGPFAGVLMDRIHPARLCAWSFAWIALFPLTLAFLPRLLPASPAAAAYTAFAIYSIGMAGINVTWNVGSIAFAPPGQGGYYQGIHVAMVGLRGLAGPLIGFGMLRLFGYREVFVLSALCFAASAAGSVLLARRLGRSGAPGPVAAAVVEADGRRPASDARARPARPDATSVDKPVS